MNFQVIFLIDLSNAVANIFVNIHIASAPSLNFRGLCDALLKQCGVYEKSPKRLPLQIINNSVNYQKYSFPFFLSIFVTSLSGSRPEFFGSMGPDFLYG